MINIDSQVYKNWIAFLPGKLKTKGRLESAENPEERCCLGHCCAANKKLLGLVVDVDPTDRTENRYNKLRGSLPDVVASALNIHRLGNFTNEGQELTELWIDKRGIDFIGTLCNLASVNDSTDATPDQICELIQYLAAKERELGKDLFNSYENNFGNK